MLFRSTAAQASDINIWICTPIDENTVRIHPFGSTTNKVENLDFNSLTAAEKYLVKQVVEGDNIGFTLNTFPTAFYGQTISLGYQQSYLENVPFPMGSETGMISLSKEGAVFLHVALDDISMTTAGIFKMVLITLFLVSLAATLITFLMSNNILDPVNHMK